MKKEIICHKSVQIIGPCALKTEEKNGKKGSNKKTKESGYFFCYFGNK